MFQCQCLQVCTQNTAIDFEKNIITVQGGVVECINNEFPAGFVRTTDEKVLNFIKQHVFGQKIEASTGKVFFSDFYTLALSMSGVK